MICNTDMKNWQQKSRLFDECQHLCTEFSPKNCKTLSRTWIFIHDQIFRKQQSTTTLNRQFFFSATKQRRSLFKISVLRRCCCIMSFFLVAVVYCCCRALFSLLSEKDSINQFCFLSFSLFCLLLFGWNINFQDRSPFLSVSADFR